MVAKTGKARQALSFWWPNREAQSASAMAGSPKKHAGHRTTLWKSHVSSFWLTVLTIFACASMLRFLYLWHPGPPEPGSRLGLQHRIPSTSNARDDGGCAGKGTATGSETWAPRRVRDDANMTAVERAFWQQPESSAAPCVELSAAFRKESGEVVKQRGKYVIVVVNGGLNQQRNQIVDAVVMARVLGAALVVPVMEVNPIWEDDSEFSDIFDIAHFKHALRDDVRIVSSLPSTHVMSRPVEEKHTPMNASPQWLRQHYQGKINREGVLLLRGLDSRLSKDLSPDLQKLRCKVAFHALRFAAPIHTLGMRLAERMRKHGPFVALHLRLEIDVWVRTGCLPGLGKALDDAVRAERKLHPWMLTARGAKLGFTERKLAGLCPLTGAEVSRLLQALGASERTRVYWAGGEPLGKDLALQPLKQSFPSLYNKESLATPEELAPFQSKASILAAIDYLVCLNSDVFLQSHGGNFGRLMQGHRAYLGHRKHIVPNKRQMIVHFLNASMPSHEFGETIRALHSDVGTDIDNGSVGGFRDVLRHPFPDCMCTPSSPPPPHIVVFS